MGRKFILILLFLHTGLIVNGQLNSRMKNHSWVRIMKDETSVNYFKAQKDYEKFRKAYVKEEKKEEEARKKAYAKKGISFPNEPHLEDPVEYVMRSYENWARSMKPFVSEDGKVMPVEERMKIIEGKK